MENELKELIENTLDVPCYIDAGTITYPSAEVSVYLDNPELFGDGKAKAVTHYVSVDLWYEERTERDMAVAALIPKLQEAGFTYPTCEREFDTTAQKYRATLKFSR